MKFDGLVKIMARLRGPDGCPWDLAQTLSDLRPFIMEEAMEVVDAIDSGNRLCVFEELGDLLFEIVFAARILEEEGVCDMDDIIAAIAEKMIERHPHIFGDKILTTAEEVSKSWEEIKAEKRSSDSVLDGVSESLSALVVAEKYGRRASEIGFDWKHVEDVIAKLNEEIDELNDAIKGGGRSDIEDEIGDMLFTVVNISRSVGVNPELALRKTNRKFSNRFRHMEKHAGESGRSFREMDIDEMERLWQNAKEVLKNRDREIE
ncbi:MAG: nucleoside triphosphate pyrophosphohydrolase [Deltaproteobacteria bacterium]|nr:nucleoside triphosphate pyrophosphohydrolase [Candidatus Zymogenaceae bacterium]